MTEPTAGESRPAGVSGPDAEQELFSHLDPALTDWWINTFGDATATGNDLFTPPQLKAIPHVLNDEHVLIAAPTGSGKTLAAFTAVINRLLDKARNETLDNTVYCLYISPLKSLANDIQRNLETPLSGVAEIAGAELQTSIRHAIRHGDTPDADRQAMLSETPHILNTTPETLAILLNAPKFREKLRSVEYVIVDEIHSLAGNKRGSHLAVSIERLAELTEQEPTRIGCSATIEPLEQIADFLVGCDNTGEVRSRAIVDCRFIREYDLELRSPTADLIGTPPGVVRSTMYEELDKLIETHTTTIVFTNTRSGAERVLHELRERYSGYEDEQAACHHGSLAKQDRQRVENALRAGELSVVTTSTSLELGIDMPTVDLVVQIGSPKSVSALLQRFGRSGHSLGETVTGRVYAMDRDELLECAVMLDRALSGFIDRVAIPKCPLDVAVQHVYGMAIAAVREERTVRQTLASAFPFRSLTDDQWECLMRYMTADYVGLDERNVYAKIWRDTNDPPEGQHHHKSFGVGTPLIGKRGRLARVIYLTNIGTIPDSFSCNVFTRECNEWVGSLDEEYLDTLDTGDVFLLGGQRFSFRYRRGSRVYVDPTNDRPTVPSWYSERLPLSFDLAGEILSWQAELVEIFDTGGVTAVEERVAKLPLDGRARSAITQLVRQQIAFAGQQSISTPSRLAIEEELDRGSYERRYYIHSCYGRRFNDGLSRLLASKCAEVTDANVSIAVADMGFCLSMPLNRKVDIVGILTEISPAAVREELKACLRGTELRKRYFRMNATRSLMILTRYKGYEKSARQQQVSSEMLLGFADELSSFAVIEETDRELLEDKLNVAAIEAFIESISQGEITISRIRVGSPSPFAFGLATLSASDVILAADESEALQAFHRRVLAAIDEAES